jgi:hypothetical protein
MKKYLLIALLVTVSFYGRSQTKGTNTIGMGMSFQTNEMETPDNYYSERSNANYSLGYGYFFKENQKAGLTLFVRRFKGLNKYPNTGGADVEPAISWSYGGSFDYQRYHPLIKQLYIFAGARTGYQFTEAGWESNEMPSNRYSGGVHGGVSWIPFKRFALEADLLSADLVHINSKSEYGSRIRSTNFDLSSTGDLNGLGFKIYFLF